jgi:hypothetical protein
MKLTVQHHKTKLTCYCNLLYNLTMAPNYDDESGEEDSVDEESVEEEVVVKKRKVKKWKVRYRS